MKQALRWGKVLLICSAMFACLLMLSGYKGTAYDCSSNPHDIEFTLDEGEGYEITERVITEGSAEDIADVEYDIVVDHNNGETTIPYTFITDEIVVGTPSTVDVTTEDPNVTVSAGTCTVNEGITTLKGNINILELTAGQSLNATEFTCLPRNDSGSEDFLYVTLNITANDHDYEWVPNANGTQHDHVCSICEDIEKTEDCTFGEWEIITPAGQKTEGLKQRTCSVCGQVQEEVIPAAGTPAAGDYAPVALCSLALVAAAGCFALRRRFATEA